MMAIYFLILLYVAGAALLVFLCLSKPSDKENKAGSDPSIASSSTLKNSHQTGTDAKSTAKAKIKEEKPVDPYENLAVANVDDALNLREKPDTDAKVLGTCFRGGGGTILKRKNGWTKIRSGGLEGWLKDDYLVFGDDIKPLAKELGLYIATVSTQTLHVREEASTDSAIVGLAAAEDYYPVLSQETGWVKIQLSVDTSGYVSSDYVTISVSQDAQSALRLRWQRWRRHDRLLKKLSRHPEPPKKPRSQPQNRRQKQTRLKVPPRLRENLEILEALRKRARLHQPLNRPTWSPPPRATFICSPPASRWKPTEDPMKAIWQSEV